VLSRLVWDHTAVARVTRPHRHAARGPWHRGPPDPSPARCPGCGSPLRIDPAGSADSDWLVGTCPAQQCGEAVVYRVCERRLIVADRRKPAPRR
jgi:hypothetical protein